MTNNSPIDYIDFINYNVNSFEYRRNNKLKKSIANNLRVENKFQSNIYFSIKKSNEALINIKAEIGGLERQDSPFILSVDLSGAFKFSFNKGDFSDEQKYNALKEKLSTDGNNLMFPYVRTLISELTLKSNMFPSCVLPIVDFAKLLKDKGKIEFFNLDNKD